MSEEALHPHKLELFLSQHAPNTDTKLNTIRKVLRKVESDVNLSSRDYTSLSKSLPPDDPVFQKPLQNAWSSQKSPNYQKKNSNLSTSISNDESSILDRLPESESFIIESKSLLDIEESTGAREKHSYTLIEHSSDKVLGSSLTSDILASHGTDYNDKSFSERKSSPSHPNFIKPHCSQEIVNVEEDENTSNSNFAMELITWSPIKADYSLMLALDESIFSSELVSVAEKITSTNSKSYTQDLIDYVQANKIKLSKHIYKEIPRQEAVYSVIFEGNSLLVFRYLLEELSTKLKEESSLLRQKYQEDFEYIGTKYQKIKESEKFIKFGEKELQRLLDKLIKLYESSEINLIKTNLDKAIKFLKKIISRIPFSSKYQKTFSMDKSIQIDYITLPKLLENLIDPDQGMEQVPLIIYTYDIYMDALNLIFYLILKYLGPAPINMTFNEEAQYRTQTLDKLRSHILNIMILWISERRLDFLKHPTLAAVLNDFLEYINLDDKKSPNLMELIKKLKRKSRDVSLRLLKIKKKESSSVDQNHHSRKKSLFFRASISKILNLLTPGHTPSTTNEVISTNENEPYSIHNLLEVSSEVIAQQLTLIDWKKFCKIDISELILKRWTKMDKSECPYYWKYVRRFNSFSYWLQYLLLSQESIVRRVKIAEKFLEIATICLKSYNNYCSPHYIFSALHSLTSLGVLSFQKDKLHAFNKLKGLFLSVANVSQMYEKLFRESTEATIPNLNYFLKIFLKLQDGVNFFIKLPESKNRFIKYYAIAHVYEYCEEMKKLQRRKYSNISKDHAIYKYLKNDYKNEFDIDLDNDDLIMIRLKEMVESAKERKAKISSFFD